MSRTRIGGSIVGVLVLLLGVLALWQASRPQGSAGGGSAEPIVISGAYVRAPLPPTHNAAAYFRVTNNSGTADRLLSVDSGAGESTVLHVTVGGSMTTTAAGVPLAAHGTLTLSPGHGHVMIENVIGTLRPGDNVNLVLTFAKAGSYNVDARVIAPTAPVPSG